MYRVRFGYFVCLLVRCLELGFKTGSNTLGVSLVFLSLSWKLVFFSIVPLLLKYHCYNITYTQPSEGLLCSRSITSFPFPAI